MTDATGFSNFTGAINGSAVLAQAIGNKHSVGICLIHSPSDLQSTTYSTSNSGAWTITIFFIRRKKDKLYNKNKDVITSIVKLQITSKINDNKLIRLINYEGLISIPISIFKNHSPLEALVKYLKESLNLSLSEISRLLNRDQRTIWITYNNAKKKIKEFSVSGKILIPINIFHNRSLSILENIVYYLHQKEISLNKISNVLNRDYKTIWTVYDRTRKKQGL